MKRVKYLPVLHVQLFVFPAIIILSLERIPYSTLLRRKLCTKMYFVSKYQGFQSFKPRCVLAIKYISKSKETLKLLLNIRIILSSNQIQLLQKQEFVNYLVKKLCETAEHDFLYFTSSLKKYGKYVLLFSQSNCSYFYVIMIIKT